MWPLSIVLFYLLTVSNGEYFEECSEIAEGTYIANRYDCRSYIYCGDEVTSFMDKCPKDSYFKEETTECVIDNDNICPGFLVQEEIEPEELAEQPTQPQFTTTTAKKPQEIMTTVSTRPVCDRHQDAYFPHYQRCEYYFKCIAGYLTILRCNLFYAWDYRREMCVSSEMAECYVSSTSI